MSLEPGWYKHADHPNLERYWDGESWTDHLRDPPSAADNADGPRQSDPLTDTPPRLEAAPNFPGDRDSGHELVRPSTELKPSPWRVYGKWLFAIGSLVAVVGLVMALMGFSDASASTRSAEYAVNAANGGNLADNPYRDALGQPRLYLCPGLGGTGPECIDEWLDLADKRSAEASAARTQAWLWLGMSALGVLIIIQAARHRRDQLPSNNTSPATRGK